MNVRAFGVCKKVAPVTNLRHLGTLLHEYLDESRKAAAVNPVLAALNHSRSEDYKAAVQNKQAPLRAGIDYVPSPVAAKVRLFGLVRQAMANYFPDVDNADPKALLDQTISWWSEQVQGRKVVASNIIFSLHPAISAELAKQGISIDEVLFANVSHALEVYAKRHYPGEAIGWVGGVHHDRSHPHLHAVIFPLTSEGRRLNLSPLASVNDGNGGKVRVDFQGTLTRAYWERCKETAELAFGVNNERASRPSRMAADVASAVAAANIAAKSGGNKPAGEAFREGLFEAERLPDETLHGLVGKLSQEAGQTFDRRTANRVRVNVQQLRADIQQRRRHTAEKFSELMQARLAARSSRGTHPALGPLLGFDQKAIWPGGRPDSKQTVALAPLVADQTARTQRYADLVKSFSGRPAGESLTLTTARVTGVVGLSNILGGQVSGTKPFFLQSADDTPAISRQTAKDRSDALVNRFAKILKDHKDSLRHFTVAEFGNVALSPYRSPAAETDPAPAQPSPEIDDEVDSYLERSRKCIERLGAINPINPAPETVAQDISPSL